MVDLNNILASGIIENDAEMVKLIFFGNLSVPDFSFDEFALLAVAHAHRIGFYYLGAT